MWSLERKMRTRKGRALIATSSIRPPEVKRILQVQNAPLTALILTSDV